MLHSELMCNAQGKERESITCFADVFSIQTPLTWLLKTKEEKVVEQLYF